MKIRILYAESKPLVILRVQLRIALVFPYNRIYSGLIMQRKGNDPDLGNFICRPQIVQLVLHWYTGIFILIIINESFYFVDADNLVTDIVLFAICYKTFHKVILKTSLL